MKMLLFLFAVGLTVTSLLPLSKPSKGKPLSHVATAKLPEAVQKKAVENLGNNARALVHEFGVLLDQGHREVKARYAHGAEALGKK